MADGGGAHRAQAPWTEKHRPTRLADVRGHDVLRGLLIRAAANGCANMPPMIFFGPSGTGKTSLALALAHDTYPALPQDVTTLYLNASDERSIEVVRDRILDFARATWPGVGRKFVIFDEVETMTEPAQLSLRTVLDAATESTGSPAPPPLIIFLCNTLYRVHASLRSRAIAFFVGHLPPAVVRAAVADVEAREGRPPSEPLSDTTLAVLRGDLRAILAAAQQDTEPPNTWSAWLARLAGAATEEQAAAAWQEAAGRVPLHVAIRHSLVWLHAQPGGLPAAAADFVAVAVDVRDAPAAVAVPRLAAAWFALARGLPAAAAGP
jgi:replication-associated recombination protein RarA